MKGMKPQKSMRRMGKGRKGMMASPNMGGMSLR